MVDRIVSFIPEWNSWIALLLYWMPLALCAYGYTMRAILKIRRDLEWRRDEEAGEKQIYYPTDAAVALLPCPFCGNDMNDDEGCFQAGGFRAPSTPHWVVRCGNPSCNAETSAVNQDVAITAWNARAQAPAAGDALDAERYRWLRDQASWWLVSTPDAAKLSVMLPRASIDAAIGTEGCDFDAAIDSAMTAGLAGPTP